MRPYALRAKGVGRAWAMWAVLLSVAVLSGTPVRGDSDRIAATIEFMSGIPSRISGYPGSVAAADYIANSFAQIGVKEISRESFGFALPVDLGGHIVAKGRRMALYGLWPNLVRTSTLPPEGLHAPMIYGGKGEFHEFNGKEMDGRVVLLEYNSRDHWLRAASLGATAVVFIAPEEERSGYGKYMDAPIDVQRFWIGREDGLLLRDQLLNDEIDVEMYSRMDWQQSSAENIWGVIPGSDPDLAAETVVVQTYYDSWSVVPAISPGAEAASGIAVMLELARHLAANPPARTTVLAATAAHFLDRQGMVDFVQRHARKMPYYAERMEKPLHPKLFLCLDLSSKTDFIGLWNNTYSYDLKRFFVPFGRRFTAYAEETAQQLGRSAEGALANGISPIKGMDWSTFVPGGLYADGEVALNAGQLSLTLATVHDARFNMGGPLDTSDKVDIDNLSSQSRQLNSIIFQALDDPDLFAGLEDFGPVLKDNLRDLWVKLRSFPRRSQVPDRPVPGAIVVVDDRFYIADDKGEVHIQGLELGGTPISAYGLKPETGEVVYAPDVTKRAEDFHGSPTGSGYLTSTIRWQTNEKTIVMFPAQSETFYGLVHARLLSVLREPKVLDRSGVPPRQYGFKLGGEAGVIFGQQDAGDDDGLKILMKGNSLMLINSEGGATEEDARGQGYVLGKDKLQPTEYLAVRDMWQLNDARLQTMRRHAIENQRLNRLHEQGRKLIEQAETARQALEWDRFVANVRAALGVTARAYPDVLGTLNDVIDGMVFFLALVIPAAFFGERLLFAAPDIRWQLAGFGLLLLIIWVIISQIHPAFAIAHPLIILLGFAIMALAAFVLSMTTSRFNRFMKEHRSRSANIHEVDISRSSAAYAAFMLGISNMRRRKLRTGLTLLTLTLLTFTVLSFTSFNDQVRFMAFSVPQKGAYEGVLIRDRGWNTLSFNTLDYTQSHFDEYGVVSPRNWYIAIDDEQKKYIEIRRDSLAYQSTGLLGLTPQETQVTGIDRILVEGSFFERPDEDSCLLPLEIAANLGIGPEDVGLAQIQIFGRQFVVRGLFDPALMQDVKDLDNEELTPADFQMSSNQIMGPTNLPQMEVIEETSAFEIRPFVHLDAANTVIMPFETLNYSGGSLRSIAVRLDDGSQGRDLVEDFLTRLAITLFAGLREVGQSEIDVFSYTSVGLTSVEGLGALAIPLLIAALIVLNAMLGAVYERFREIGIYSSVGLAPVHIALLFVAEACVYAVIGVTLGYILGQGLGKVLIAFDLMQGLNLNYSSISAILSSLVVMVVVLLSTIYPARVAAQSAVPDTVRRWVPPPPDGDKWVYEFPFMVSVGEVVGLCGFLQSYFRAYSEESIGTFYAEMVRIAAEDGDDGREYGVQMLLWLAPFDMGVSQYVQLGFVPSTVPGTYVVEIFIQRISGQDTFWRRVNEAFANGLRKEFLIWHTLNAEAKNDHRRQAEDSIVDTAGEGEGEAA
jgi:hypothetical protein